MFLDTNSDTTPVEQQSTCMFKCYKCTEKIILSSGLLLMENTIRFHYFICKSVFKLRIPTVMSATSKFYLDFAFRRKMVQNPCYWDSVYFKILTWSISHFKKNILLVFPPGSQPQKTMIPWPPCGSALGLLWHGYPFIIPSSSRMLGDPSPSLCEFGVHWILKVLLCLRHIPIEDHRE